MYPTCVSLFNRASRRAHAAQARAQQLPTHVSADDLETMLTDRSAYDVAANRLVATMQRLGAKYGFDPVADAVHNHTGQILRTDKALMPVPPSGPDHGLVEQFQAAADAASKNGTIHRADEEATHATA